MGNSTVLPNGQVIVTGGTQFADNGGTDAVFAAERWHARAPAPGDAGQLRGGPQLPFGHDLDVVV